MTDFHFTLILSSSIRINCVICLLVIIIIIYILKTKNLFCIDLCPFFIYSSIKPRVCNISIANYNESSIKNFVHIQIISFLPLLFCPDTKFNIIYIEWYFFGGGNIITKWMTMATRKYGNSFRPAPVVSAQFWPWETIKPLRSRNTPRKWEIM